MKGPIMETATDRFRAHASQLAAAFTTGKRHGTGEPYTFLRTGSPQWMADAVRAAHVACDGTESCRLPCDWVYSVAAAAADYASGFESAENAADDSAAFADGQVDVYTADALTWLAASAWNRALADEAVAEYGPPAETGTAGAEKLAQRGQLLGAERIYRAIVDAIAAE